MPRGSEVDLNKGCIQIRIPGGPEIACRVVPRQMIASHNDEFALQWLFWSDLALRLMMFPMGDFCFTMLGTLPRKTIKFQVRFSLYDAFDSLVLLHYTSLLMVFVSLDGCLRLGTAFRDVSYGKFRFTMTIRSHWNGLSGFQCISMENMFRKTMFSLNNDFRETN